MLRIGVSFLIVFASLNVLADAWPQFRGVGSSGISDNERLPLEWAPDKNIAWKAEVPGSGWSCPIVWEDKVIVTTAVPQGKEDAVKSGLYFGGERATPPDFEYDWRVLCYSLADGKLLWDREVKAGRPTHGKHIKNTYASETPATDGRFIYAYFGQVGIVCLDMEGNIRWKKELGTYATANEWGTGSSPITDGHLVYLQCDNNDSSFLVAFDAETGDEKWRIPREEKTNWSTPFLWRHEKGTELVTSGRSKARSYDPSSGQLIWELGGMSTIVVPTPIAGKDFLFVSSGYVMDMQHRPIFAIKPGASGDITLEKSQDSSNAIAWSQKMAGSYMPTPILYQDQLYVLYDRGLFASYDAKTGKEIYSKKRLPKGGNFTASPWAYRGKIFVLSEDGTTQALEAGPEFKLSHVNAPLDEHIFMSTPALAGDSLIIRGATTLYCIQEPK